MKWINIISGIVLVAFGFSGTPAAMWAGLIMGAIIVFLGWKESYKWLAGAGLVTMLIPFILGFSGIPAALWSWLIVGAVVLVMNGYQGFLSDEAQSGGRQQHTV